MNGKRYALFLRPTDAKNRAKRAAGKKFKGVYYVQFKLPDGSWSNAKSTHTSNEVEAEDWANNYLERGKVVTRERAFLKDIAEDFFAWPDGPYATNRRAGGMRISARQCRDKESAIKLRVIPNLGNVLLQELTKGAVRELRNKLFNSELSGGSINKTLFALRAVLQHAEERSLVQTVPDFDFAANKQERRGILTPEEVSALFALPWPDKRCYVANLTAAGSGLRSGEVVGLQHRCVHPKYLEVSHAWSPSGLKSTKTDTVRLVPIPDRVYEALKEIMAENPFGPSPDSFVFYGSRSDRPMDQRLATEALYEALAGIRIDEAGRKERRIDFHSWRHWYNAFLVNKRVPVHKVRSIVGHTTEAMTEKYYHADEYEDVRKLMDGALGKPI